MTHSAHFSQITDELLSAYIDQEVTPHEKSLIEVAVAADPALAWRLDTLRQTVQLLRTLPAVALPRAFILTEAQLTAAAREAVAVRATRFVPTRLSNDKAAPTGWQTLLAGWRNFWQTGSPLLRNAMAASFALLLVLLVSDSFLAARLPELPRVRMARPVEVAVILTQPPTAVAVVGQMAAPAEAVVVDATTAQTTSESQETAPQVSTQRLNPTAQTKAFSASAPPGEDQGIALVPGSPEVTASSAATMDQASAGGEQQSAPAAAAVAADPRPDKQTNPAATTSTLTSATFVSPLEAPVAAAALSANPITATEALTAEVAAAQAGTPSMVVIPPGSVTATGTINNSPTLAAVVAPPPSPLLPAGQSQDGESSPADRIRLLQIVSALVTVVLAGLWWRSR